jgi:SanA protein
MKRLKKLIIIFLIASIPLAIIVCNHKIELAAKGKLYETVQDIPYKKVGLLLGTSKYDNQGYENLYYTYRIRAAVELINSGKIKYIIVSGDNSKQSYNEPEMMRQDLIAQGVDSSIIFLDYAGFRTFDSIVRLEKIFGQKSATIISQKFHNERALFIASKEEIDAIGFNAQDVSTQQGFKTKWREKLARVKVYIDYIIGKKPKFLGEKIIIPE